MQIVPATKDRQFYHVLLGPMRRMLLRVLVFEALDTVSRHHGLQDEQCMQERTVKVIYDKETESLSKILMKGKVVESDEPYPRL